MPEPEKWEPYQCEDCGGGGQRPTAAWLRWRRAQLGLRMQDIADRYGCSLTFICNVERGNRGCPQPLAAIYEQGRAA